MRQVHDATLPSEIKLSEHSLALQSAPNLDLLKRQRTFTIDETRELLRQGRPVHKEALLSGAVDYRSLHYGDEHHGHGAHGAHGGHGHHSNAAQKVSSSGSHGSAADTTPSASVAAAAATAPATATTTGSSHAPAVSADLAGSPADRAVKDAAKPDIAQPVSPLRASASSWAAMVKSAADVAGTAPTLNGAQSSLNKSSPIRISTASAAAKPGDKKPRMDVKDNKDSKKDTKETNAHDPKKPLKPQVKYHFLSLSHNSALNTARDGKG